VAGAASRVYLGDQFATAWRNWFLGNALASLVLTPLLVSLVTGRLRFDRARPWPLAKAVFIVSGLTLGLYVAFHRGSGVGGHPPFLLYAPVPFLLAAAVVYGLIGASGSLLFVCLVAIFETVGGRGPFYQLSAAASLLSIQLFLFFLSVPFLFLSVLIDQQRKTENSLRESELRFRSMVDTAPVMVWMADATSLCTFFNKPWLEFTGRRLREEEGSGWSAGVHPQDRERWAAQYDSAFAAHRSFTREYRLRRNDGVYRWVLESGLPRYGSNAEFLGYIGSCIDITDRKEAEDRVRQMSAQLLHAQETERFRIGQELHDDLAQRAAALSMGLKHLARTSDEREKLVFEELQEQSMDLCRGIALISHQLRPAALETLGLAAALRSLCSQSTSDTHTITLYCNRNLPQLSDVTAISLYRIAQEAIRNALKHSGAARVDVELGVSRSTVILSIKDNGCGFVVEPAALSGLGLSGMAERMRNVNGNLNIVSAPGQGTTVQVTVPIGKAMQVAAK
jgi:PAS domain S-box-containing protein